MPCEPRFPRSARLAAAALLACAAVPAQFVNRAVWLGADEEGVRREFRQGREYFLDRMSYVDVPPWHERGLRRFDDGVDYRFGSVTGSEFSFEGRLDRQTSLGDGFSFAYHLLQSETRDARYLRNVIGLEYETGETTALFAQGTPLADKSLIDVSVGAWLWRREGCALRAMVTLVDAPGDKSRTVELLTRPVGLHVAGVFGDVGAARVAFDLGAQLPFEQRDRQSGDRFELERYIGTVTTQLPLGGGHWLHGALESEYTDKGLLPAAVASPLREGFDRTFHQARVEWWRDSATPWSVGFVHTYHSEDGVRPNDPSADLRTRRREWFGVARVGLPVGEQLSLEPQLFAGNVRYSFHDGVVAEDADGFEGKLSCAARWQFSPDAALTLIVSVQLDEAAFGGGGCQFVARF